ncbi:MAG: histidine phosphatase family protein [Phycisphaerae bacterium]
MMVALVPCAASEWRREGRLLGRVELAMLPDGLEQCGQWSELLRPVGLRKLVHSPDELATRTAAALGERLALHPKPVDELAEVDVGLWAGLTDADLESRYESAHHELCDAPLNVTAPGGESLGAAFQRIDERLRKLVRDARRRTPAGFVVVLRPLALAAARVALEAGDAGSWWALAQEPDAPAILRVAGAAGPAGRAAP